MVHKEYEEYTIRIYNFSGDIYWYQDGKLRRKDGSVIEKEDSPKSWYWKGKTHRTDGPIIVLPDGSKFYLMDLLSLDESKD